MSVPVCHQYSYRALTIHLAVLAILIALALWLSSEGVLLIFFVYWGWYFLLRSKLTIWQLKGMRAIKWGEYGEAIGCFQRSYDYFERNLWIDKYRYIVLLSCSKISYREMALCNLAFCYGQTGDARKAWEYYRKALKQFPDSMVAKTSLNLLNPLMEQLGECTDVPMY